MIPMDYIPTSNKTSAQGVTNLVDLENVGDGGLGRPSGIANSTLCPADSALYASGAP